jgi:hypothetical protein
MVAIVIADAVPEMGESCAVPVEPRRSGIRLHSRHPDPEEETMDATTLAAVRMPNRDGFVSDPRPDIPTRRPE